MDNEKPTNSSQRKLANRVNKANTKTAAAVWNREFLHRLGRVLATDPEADLACRLSPSYSETLNKFKGSSFHEGLILVLMLTVTSTWTFTDGGRY